MRSPATPPPQQEPLRSTRIHETGTLPRRCDSPLIDFLSSSCRRSARTEAIADSAQANAKPANVSGSQTFQSCRSPRLRSRATSSATVEWSSAADVDQSVSSPPRLTVLAPVNPPPVNSAVRLLVACALTTESPRANTVYTVVVDHCPWNGPGVRPTARPTGSRPPVMLSN